MPVLHPFGGEDNVAAPHGCGCTRGGPNEVTEALQARKLGSGASKQCSCEITMRPMGALVWPMSTLVCALGNKSAPLCA